MIVLKQGEQAPDFDMAVSGGGQVKLSDFAGKPLILYFYPKDNTPGCTKEACEFRDDIAAFKGVGAHVLGVSKDSVASHEKFAAKHDLPFLLASDPDGAVCAAYGAWGEKSMMGRKYMGIIRSSFLIDGRGRIAQVWYNIKVPGHVEAVKKALSDVL